MDVCSGEDGDDSSVMKPTRRTTMTMILTNYLRRAGYVVELRGNLRMNFHVVGFET